MAWDIETITIEMYSTGFPGAHCGYDRKWQANPLASCQHHCLDNGQRHGFLSGHGLGYRMVYYVHTRSEKMVRRLRMRERRTGEEGLR